MESTVIVKCKHTTCAITFETRDEQVETFILFCCFSRENKKKTERICSFIHPLFSFGWSFWFFFPYFSSYFLFLSFVFSSFTFSFVFLFYWDDRMKMVEFATLYQTHFVIFMFFFFFYFFHFILIFFIAIQHGIHFPSFCIHFQALLHL